MDLRAFAKMVNYGAGGSMAPRAFVRSHPCAAPLAAHQRISQVLRREELGWEERKDCDLWADAGPGLPACTCDFCPTCKAHDRACVCGFNDRGRLGVVRRAIAAGPSFIPGLWAGHFHTLACYVLQVDLQYLAAPPALSALYVDASRGKDPATARFRVLQPAQPTCSSRWGSSLLTRWPHLC